MFSAILTDAQKQAIGEVAIESAILDMHLKWLIWRICRFKPTTGEEFTGNIQISAKLNLFVNLIKTKRLSAENRERLEFINSTLSNAITDRNTIIHGLWGYENPVTLRAMEAGQFGKVVSRHRPPRAKTTRVMSAQDIAVIAQRLSASRGLLAAFYAECFVAKTRRNPLTMPEESYEQLRKKVQNFRLSKS